MAVRTRLIPLLLLVALLGMASGCSRLIHFRSVAADSVPPSAPGSGDTRHASDSILLLREKALMMAAARVDHEVLEVFLSSDSVNCYRLLYADSIAGTVEVEPGYVRIGTPVVLGAADILSLLTSLLLDPAAYGWSELRIEAPYFPFWEFEFVREGFPSASMTVSPSDRTWSMASGGRRLSNFDMPPSGDVLGFCEAKLPSSIPLSELMCRP